MEVKSVDKGSIMFRIFLVQIILITGLFADAYHINKEEYTVLSFEQSIKSLKVSNKDILHVQYNKNAVKPFTELVIYGKEYGQANIFITFRDKVHSSVEVTIGQNINSLTNAITSINPTILVESYGGNKYLLKGNFKDLKEKQNILKMLDNSDINSSSSIIDLSTTQNPPKMAKIKMYIVEMSNKNIDEFTSNLQILNGKSGDTSYSADLIHDESITLDGMFSSMISHLGSNFDLVQALKVLKKEQLATVLDESTINVMEGDSTAFHSGGVIHVRGQGTTSEGQPISNLEKLNYGVKLDIALHSINTHNDTMQLSIDTESTTLNWNEEVDGIPGFGTKSIKTKMAARNNEAIILSGLVSYEDTKVISKIPLLGDIPIFGKLFRSEKFQNGESELMFFLVPVVEG